MMPPSPDDQTKPPPMSSAESSHRRRATRIALGLLALGLGASAVIFWCAGPPEADPLGYDRLMNKRYVLELERLGGKANVMTAEFMDWFGGLWHGRSLSGTVAVLTVGVAAAYWFIATLPPEKRAEIRHALRPHADE